MGDLHGLRLGGAVDPILASDPGVLLRDFESLGDGCEFGLVQRCAGIEPLGLLRFAEIAHAPLLDLIAAEFPPLGDDVRIDIAANDEFCATIPRYGILYHTGFFAGQISADDALLKERVRLDFYCRKMMQTVRDGAKIFVRFDDRVGEAEIRGLADRLRGLGAARLLWIDIAPEPDLVGRVSQIAPGLLRAYLGRHAPDAAPDPATLALWFHILRTAHDLLIGGEPDRDLVLRGGWTLPRGAEASLSRMVPRRLPGHPVVEHGLSVTKDVHDGSVLTYEIRQGMRAGAIYCISAWVWLPADFVGTRVCLLANGFSSLASWPADLSRREQWQHVTTSFRQPGSVEGASPALMVTADADTRLYSTCWRLDVGAVPPAYLDDEI